MAHRFRDPAPSTPNSPAELGGHDHYHRFLRRLFGPQVRSASRSQGHLDRTTASAGLCCRANSLRSNQPNLCGMMWLRPLAANKRLASAAEGATNSSATRDRSMNCADDKNRMLPLRFLWNSLSLKTDGGEPQPAPWVLSVRAFTRPGSTDSRDRVQQHGELRGRQAAG